MSSKVDVPQRNFQGIIAVAFSKVMRCFKQDL